jgi:hypothetical protein
LCDVFPSEIIQPDGDAWECVFAENPNVRLGEFQRCGTLDS